MDDDKRDIFVFGSNLAGRHGAGAALHAKKHYGAIYGKGYGKQGNSYAIPTKDEYLETLPLNIIKDYVQNFIGFTKYAKWRRPEYKFIVTNIGTGLAGYKISDIAPMFRECLDLDNVVLSEEFKEYLKHENT